MSLSSWEEDALFEEWGWYKNLIKRQYEGPQGHVFPFDEVMNLTGSPEGEDALRQVVQDYGQRDSS